MMGGMLGLVGLGRVRLSLNMALLPRSLGGLQGSGSAFSLLERIEDCDTPVDGALAIRLAAFGVAVCKIGLLIVGLRGTVGFDEALSGSTSLDGDTVVTEEVVGDVIDDTGDEATGEDEVTEGDDLDEDDTVVVVANESG